jgi:hypothetical protein
MWENAPASRNVISRSQSLSTMHNSLNRSLFTRPGVGVGSRTPLSSSTHFTGGAPLLPNRTFSGANTASTQQLRSGLGFNRFGHPFGGFHGGFGRFGRCWNCGFGFGGFGPGWGWGGWGLGFGWGWPGWGWGWSPLWIDPWWGWGWPAAGYYGAPVNNYVYNYSSPDSGNYAPEDNSAPPSDENQYDENDNNEGTPSGNWVMPNTPSPATAPYSSGVTVPVLLYMRTGAVITVRDYWMIDNVLHYIQMNGAQKAVDLDQVDLARTNTENAKSGVKFIFKSEPNAQPRDENPAPPQAQPDSGRPGAVVQPEART